MPHPVNRESPVRPTGTNTEYQKSQRIEREDAREEKALRRYKILRRVKEEGWLDLPTTEAHAFVEQAVEDGELPEPAPSRRTLQRWIDKYLSGEGPLRIQDCYDRNRKGRDPKEFDPAVLQYLQQEVKIGAFRSVADLHRGAVGIAEAVGVEPPTYDRVKRWYDGKDPAVLSAQLHGKHAAIADNLPSLSVPADQPWEVATLDETVAPVWISAYDPDREMMIPVKPWLILLVDNFSDAILARRVVPPFEYGSEPTYTGRDILGTVLSAALPEFSSEATQEFSGFLPRTLRWDQHQSHQEAQDRLQRIGVEIPDTRGYKPWAQGQSEVVNGIVKNACYQIWGFSEKFIPATEVEDDLEELEQKAAASKDGREPTKQPVPINGLLSYEEFVEALDEQIERYNSRERRNKPSPKTRYFRELDEGYPLPGENARHALDKTVVTVSKHGVRCRGDTFTWKTREGRLTVGQQVLVRPDPLQRGVYLMEGARPQLLRPASEVDRTDNHVQHLRHLQRVAKEADEDARAARRALLQQELGEGALEEMQYEIRSRRPLRGSGRSGVSELEEEGTPRESPADVPQADTEAADSSAGDQAEDDQAPDLAEGETNDADPRPGPRGIRNPLEEDDR